MILGLSITKQTPWRGQPQEFSNVYHFDVADAPGLDVDDGLISRIVALERALFVSDVTFVTARTWGPADAPAAQNFTRMIKDLSGVGSNGTRDATLYKETAVMVQWPLGRYGVRNRPQKLRKWLHTGKVHGLAYNGSDAASVITADLQTYIDGVTAGSFTANATIFEYRLCSKQGRDPIGPGTRYPYLEHRQYGR